MATLVDTNASLGSSSSSTMMNGGGGNNNDNNNNNINNNNNHTIDAAGMHAVAQTSNAILARLKEVEISNANMTAVVDKLKLEVQFKDDKIKELSADKRKDMEQMIDTAVEKWLSSLTDVPEDIRQQFKKGISKIAEQADMKNAAWEIVCNASLAHESNVKKIDELLKTCTEQGETIKTLMGSTSTDISFASEASRMSGGGNSQHTNNNKRSRIDMETPPRFAENNLNNNNNNSSGSTSGELARTGTNLMGGGVDAWQDFEKMMKLEMTSKYF